MTEDLALEWAADVTAGAAEPVEPAVIAAAGAELIERWAEGHRRYHDLEHLRAVLAGVTELASDADDVAAVRLAAWFHDAVYQGRPGDDEEASAQLAERVLPTLGWPAGRVAEVARLVRLTKDHAGIDAADRNGAVLADADLAILAAAEPRYLAYTRAVRQEYAQFEDAVFAAGRSYVLSRFLENPPIYRTPSAAGRWTAAAERNLTAELARLRG